MAQDIKSENFRHTTFEEVRALAASRFYTRSLSCGLHLSTSGTCPFVYDKVLGILLVLLSFLRWVDWGVIYEGVFLTSQLLLQRFL